jgi:hypothetical protein
MSAKKPRPAQIGGVALVLDELARAVAGIDIQRDAGPAHARVGLALDRALETLDRIGKDAAEKFPGDHGALTCSFCAKAQRDVKKLIAGPTVYICDECGALVNDILTEEAPVNVTVEPTDDPEKRTQAQIVFDEMSARQLSEIVRALARDRGMQAAAVTVSGDEDRNAIRIVVCAPLAGSEEEFGVSVAKSVIGEMNKAADRGRESELSAAVRAFMARGVQPNSTAGTYAIDRASWEELGRAAQKARRG